MLISNRTSRLLGIGALLLAAPTLASCTEHATDKIYTPAAGSNERSARVDVLAAVIVANADHAGEGTLILTLVNNEVAEAGSTDDVSDALTGVGGDVKAELEGDIKVPAGDHVVVATSTPTTPSDAPGIKVTGDFELGSTVDITLDFANAGEVTVEDVRIVENVEGSPFAGQNGPADKAPAQSDTQGHGSGHGASSPEESHEEPAAEDEGHEEPAEAEGH